MALGSWVWGQPWVLQSLGAKVVCCAGDEMQRCTPGYSLWKSCWKQQTATVSSGVRVKPLCKHWSWVLHVCASPAAFLERWAGTLRAWVKPSLLCTGISWSTGPVYASLSSRNAAARLSASLAVFCVFSVALRSGAGDKRLCLGGSSWLQPQSWWRSQREPLPNTWDAQTCPGLYKLQVFREHADSLNVKAVVLVPHKTALNVI